MDVGDAGGQRHVDAIVDDQRHAERRQRRVERSGELDEGPRAGRLLAQLHGGDAAADGGEHDILERTLAGHAAIGHQHQRQRLAADAAAHATTRSVRATVSPSRRARRSRKLLRKVAGPPAAVAAASSPATP